MADCCIAVSHSISKMTRREKRILRRKQNRRKKRDQTVGYADDYRRIYDMDNLYSSYKLCIRGVTWKASVQQFIFCSLLNLYNISIKLQNQEDVRCGFVSFYLFERGKKRNIYSVHIMERIPQRTLCDYVLLPIITRSLISDNFASVKGRGERCAEDALAKDLRQFYFENNNSNIGFIMFIDVHDYFGEINREALKEFFSKKFMISVYCG